MEPFVRHPALVSDGCDHEAILSAFRKRSTTSREQAIHDAYLDNHSDDLLALMLDEAADSTWEKVVIAAHLGDLTGAEGDAALRRSIRSNGPGTTDVRCASLLALTKRIAVHATPDLWEALSSANGAVKDYAVVGLAGAGDDRAWDQASEYLRAVLRRKRRSEFQSEVAMALAYLAQHVADPDRRSRLVAFIRKHWAALDEPEWFVEFWPDAAPGGPPEKTVTAPDSEALRAWARRPLFSPLGPPTF